MIEQQMVITIVKAALSNKPAEAPPELNLSEYLAFAKKQQIESLLIDGLLRLKYPCTNEMRTIAIRSAIITARQEYVINQIYEIF